MFELKNDNVFATVWESYAAWLVWMVKPIVLLT